MMKLQHKLDSHGAFPIVWVKNGFGYWLCFCLQVKEKDA
jgi:hypothetical protein